MEKYQLKKPSSIKRRKRIGCGNSSGHGKTSCRGTKGQRARSGNVKRPGFEGGQMPLQRRIPKRGFTNIFKSSYQIINLSAIVKLEIGDINPELLFEKGLIKDDTKKVKILGNGEITKPVKIIADSFSESAIKKIRDAGGDITIRNASARKI